MNKLIETALYSLPWFFVAATVAFAAMTALQAGRDEYVRRFQVAFTFTRPVKPTLRDRLLFMTPEVLLYLQLSLAGAGVVVGFVLGIMLEGFQKLLPIGLLAAAGFAIPLFLRRIALRARLDRFTEQMADAMRIVADSLKAGISFPEALRTVASELSQPISVEFGLTYNEIQLGKPRDVALQNMVKRVPVPDLRLFVVSTNTVMRVDKGMQRICDSCREMVEQRLATEKKINAMTAQGRLQAVFLAAAPFLLLSVLYLIDPSLVMVLFTTFTGMLLVFAASILDLIGFMVVRRITDIQV